MPDDARLLELTWLSELEKVSRGYGPFGAHSPEERLAIYLLAHGYAESATGPAPSHGHNFASGPVVDPDAATRWRAIAQIRDGSTVALRVTHAGAVRRAELEQQLKAGRIKEPMGLIWDGRHFRQDTRVALLDASPTHPLGVVYLDLNDVKVFNAESHATGDDAIRRYLEVIAEVSFDQGEAYRLSGGADEVLVLLPSTTEADAIAWARKVLDALGREAVSGISLRAAAGVVVATDPGESVDELKDRADRQQLRAKEESKKDPMRRPSRVAWAGDGEQR